MALRGALAVRCGPTRAAGALPGAADADARRLALTPVDAAEWAALAAGFRDHNYRQSWAFGRACAARVGATSEHVRIERDGEPIAAADVRVRRLPVVGGGIAYVNGGPLCRLTDGPAPAALHDALVALRDEYVVRRRLVLRVAPPPVPAAWADVIEKTFAAVGFAPVAQPPERTILLDLRPPLDALRAGFAQKWRNGLNGAERQGLEVERGEAPEQIAAFVQLFGAFRARKRFGLDLDAPFYAAVHADALPGERFVVTLAKRDGEVVAGHLASCLGDTSVYLLGATLPAGLRAKAGYLLQWHAIQHARERGLAWYDLGGIDPVGNPGVYHFKKGLGGGEVALPGPFEIVPRHPAVALTRLAERVYRALRARARAAR